MTATIHQFPRKRTKCANCNYPMIYRGNDPAYCQYQCGAEAQPEHVKTVKHSTAVEK